MKPNTNTTTTNKSSVDIDKLEKALDNTKNEGIMNFTTKKINELNLRILQELKLDNKTTMEYLKKLKGYKYVDELPDLKHGGFVRWIPITDPDYLPLNSCGIVCDIKIADEGVFITCKNFMHRHYNFKMDDVIIFQKLTSQEMVILSALDHLDDDTKQDLNINENVKQNNNIKGEGQQEDDADDDSDVSDISDD